MSNKLLFSSHTYLWGQKYLNQDGYNLLFKYLFLKEMGSIIIETEGQLKRTRERYRIWAYWFHENTGLYCVWNGVYCWKKCIWSSKLAMPLHTSIYRKMVFIIFLWLLSRHVCVLSLLDDTNGTRWIKSFQKRTCDNIILKVSGDNFGHKRSKIFIYFILLICLI